MNIEKCGKQCDHDSPCVLPKEHTGGHHTEHDCIFYDQEPDGRMSFHITFQGDTLIGEIMKSLSPTWERNESLEQSLGPFVDSVSSETISYLCLNYLKDERKIATVCMRKSEGRLDLLNIVPEQEALDRKAYNQIAIDFLNAIRYSRIPTHFDICHFFPRHL